MRIEESEVPRPNWREQFPDRTLGCIRAFLTVCTKSGINYDAIQVTPTWLDHTMQPALSFICSGRMTTIPADQIERIEFHYDSEQPEGAVGYCGMCDQGLPASMIQKRKS